MFVTSEKNRLAPWEMLLPKAEEASVWAAIEQLSPRDVLMLRVSPARSRVVPSIIMLDLFATAPYLEQFVGGEVVLRGAAVLSTRRGREVEQWTLDPLSEIRIGVTQPEEYSGGERLVTVTRYTTAAGRTFFVPVALAERPARGRRLWRAKAPRTEASC
ncbi:hypothetical protein [Paraburkholderia youngii]|uniref:hypothetical protein n=1 Tax=Paraburkholderia youngii TaxID=2782701 RepID=UPI003D1A6B61